MDEISERCRQVLLDLKIVINWIDGLYAGAAHVSMVHAVLRLWCAAVVKQSVSVGVERARLTLFRGVDVAVIEICSAHMHRLIEESRDSLVQQSKTARSKPDHTRRQDRRISCRLTKTANYSIDSEAV